MTNIKFEKPFGFLMLFILTFFSYKPLKQELVDLAGNATTTNAVIEFMNDGGFPIVWMLLAVVFLIAAIYYMVSQL